MTRMTSPTADDTAELVDEEQGLGVKYRLRQCFCGKYRRLVIALLILLFVGGIVFGVVWVLTRPPKICKTALCYNISRDISSQLDKSVDPCDDFYSYTCGSFFKRHKLKADQSRVDAFTILNEDNLKVLRHALQNSSFNYSQVTSIQKTVKIYNSCVNTTAINNRGIEPLEKLIEQYGGWTVTGNGTNSWTVAEKMGRVLKDLNVQTLLSITVRPDLTDSNQHIIQINPSQLGMSSSYYQDLTENLKIQQAYKTYMRTIANLLGGGSNAEQKMMDIYDFEKSLADAYQADVFSEDLVETLRQYHRSGRSLDSLDKTLYDFSIASGFWSDFMRYFLNMVFYDQDIVFHSYEKVFYNHKEDGAAPIFKSIFNTYFSYGSRQSVIQDYIMWRVVSKYVLSMPDQFVEAYLSYTEAVLGVQEYERWSSCIEGMMKPMDMTLGRMYVDADFDETTKTTVKDMTTRLRKSFIDNLDSENWMDSDTKNAAKEKANAIKEDVGYPPFIKKDSELDVHYSMLTVGCDFFENTLAMSKMLVQRNLGVLRQRVNKDLWMSGPAQINGYYSPQQNRIVFLAGILQSPFYKKNYPKYLNYGSLAMIIGHEITHGFDSSGRLFDKDGNAKDWWSYSSALNFRTRAQCLVNQYDDYEVFGEYIDGQQTLNENIADNGGIKLAYDAYQSWVSDNEKEGQLPDLGLSVDQLFFIGFAMPWCSVYKKEAALYQLKSDEHSYNKYRVIGSLSNFKRFGKAFSCSSGTNMDRENKCAVW